jgi:hypothetical protein
VFQKAVNTFAKRHHVRIWLTDDKFRGEPVWIAAATHDTGFVVSKEVKLFTHGIHPNIDLERQKIVNDLAFAGAVAGHTLVARPKAPHEAKTSIGETVQTDGRAAVIVIRNLKKSEVESQKSEVASRSHQCLRPEVRTHRDFDGIEALVDVSPEFGNVFLPELRQRGVALGDLLNLVAHLLLADLDAHQPAVSVRDVLS